MLATAQKTSTRTVTAGLPRLLIAAGALVLVLAGPARAEELSAGAAPPAVEPASSGPEPGTEGTTGAETAGTTGSTEPPAGQPLAPETTVPAETPPPEAPAGEQVSAPAEPPLPPAETTPAPLETTPGSEGKRAGELSAPAESQGPPAAKAAEPATHPAERDHSAEGQAPIVAAVAGAGETLPPAFSGPTGTETVSLTTSAGSVRSAADAPPLSGSHSQIERSAQQRSCELSLLGAPGGEGCTGGWSGPPSAGARAAIIATGPIAAQAGDAAAVTAPHNREDGGRPTAPGPGPVPAGGGVGVAAGAAGGGVGLAGFLALAGLLLLTAPRALRRMRLSCRPYRTAFFVLIPERPG